MPVIERSGTELVVAHRGEPSDTPPRLDDLLATANREHTLADAAARTALEHAIRAGEALLAVRELVQPGTWGSWLGANFTGDGTTARLYMRLAVYREHLSLDMSVNQAHRSIEGLPPIRSTGVARYDAHLRSEASELRADGRSYASIARDLGVSPGTVKAWCDPGYKQRENQRNARNKRERERRARDAAIRVAVRKAGAATQEAWAMAERMQDVLGQASREASTHEAREALSLAGEHYRRMRDQIVRALGVE